MRTRFNFRRFKEPETPNALGRLVNVAVVVAAAAVVVIVEVVVVVVGVVNGDIGFIVGMTILSVMCFFEMIISSILPPQFLTQLSPVMKLLPLPPQPLYL